MGNGRSKDKIVSKGNYVFSVEGGGGGQGFGFSINKQSGEQETGLFQTVR